MPMTITEVALGYILESRRPGILSTFLVRYLTKTAPLNPTALLPFYTANSSYINILIIFN